MLGDCRRQVVTLEVEAGAQGVFAEARRGHIAFGTDHGGQRLAVWGLRQAGDLPANALEGQLGAEREPLDLGRAGQHHHRGAGQ